MSSKMTLGDPKMTSGSTPEHHPEPECFFHLSNYLLQESLIFLFFIFFTESNCPSPPRGETKGIGRRGPPAASAREAGRPPGIRAPAPGGGRRGLLPGSACHPAAGRAGYAAHELPPGPCGGTYTMIDAMATGHLRRITRLS